MDLRVLQYFLAVAREQSITAAAESLHLSQPTLSTQLKALEEELGKQLLIRGARGSRKVVLTEEGMILRKRAEEILDLVRKTENEISLSNDVIAGDVCIGTGESNIIRIFAQTARQLQQKYPDIHYHISSGNADFVMDQLDKGLIDFGLLYDSVDMSKYDTLKVPLKDVWGVLMRRDSPAGGQRSRPAGGSVGQAPHRLPSGKRQTGSLRLAEAGSERTQRGRHLQSGPERFHSDGRRLWLYHLL